MVPAGSIRPRASALKVESRRLPAKASSAWISSSVAICATLCSHGRRYYAFVTRVVRPLSEQCIARKVAPSHRDRSDGRPPAQQQAVGDEAQRGNVDQTFPLVDQIDEGAV